LRPLDVAVFLPFAQTQQIVTRQRTPHLIGREQALRQLDRALDRVAPSRGALVVVSGEAGIGKTRLLEEFASRRSGSLVVRGGCVEHVAYAPWTDALWWLVESVGDGVVGELPRSVAAQLARLIPSLEAAEPTAGDDEEGQRLLFEAVVELLARTAASRELVLVVDDVHWIDPASRGLLRYVAGNLRRVPILLVAAYRAEDSGAERELIAQLGRLCDDRISLERLSRESTSELAANLLDPDPVAADVERIAGEAEGNPLFVEELVAAAGTRGIPETLRDLMLARFTSLDDDARHLVSVAAVIGARASRAWLSCASGLTGPRARTAARAAADAGVLVADDGGGYAFRHALLRQAVLADLLPDDRVALHRAIAQALEDDAECAVGVDRVAELAHHWDAAEDASLALRWLVVAARHAQTTYAFQAAFEAYERALVWWNAVVNAAEVAGTDHAALLLEAADAAGLAGHTERAADLARSGLDESFTLDLTRGVEAAGRAYPLLWTADRAPELFAFATSNVLPVLDRVEPGARARFLVTQAEHLASYATPVEMRGPATQMMAALDQIADPVLEARARVINAWCYEAYGEFDRADREYELAGAIARDADAFSMLLLVLLNHASFKTALADWDACLKLLDSADEVGDRFGLRRNLAGARCLRAFVSCMQGDLVGAWAALQLLDGIFLEGLDAWERANGRGVVQLSSGEFDVVLAEVEPDSVGAALPVDSELAIEIATLTADALAWKDDIVRARHAVDAGEAAVAHHRETYSHGRLAMVGMRIEADAAVAGDAIRSLAALEEAQARAAVIVDAWNAAVAPLQSSTPLVDAYSRAIDAEYARLVGEGVVQRARVAAEAFDAISMPYFATYFRWREAEAMLLDGDRPTATEVLKRARATALAHGFGGLAHAIAALARSHQLRLGPARTTVDGDEALSVRELEVLRLVVDGKSNPEIASILFISRRTAAAHVSSILRKMNASSRVEATSEAHRRGYV
jgi:DNA-binding CsgD family transcriptional regulator/tetratricopeptide (TPR) repeat protein